MLVLPIVFASADEVSEKSDTKPKPARSTEPTRAWRARERRGRCLLHVEVDEAELIAALVAKGLLAVEQADDRNALTKATEKVLKRLCDGSPSRDDIRNTIAIELILRALLRKAREAQPRPTRARPTRKRQATRTVRRVRA